MSGEMVELYSDADLARLKQKISRLCAAHFLLAGLALGACLGMIAGTNTLNAARMEGTVILVSILAGWIILYGQLFGVFPCRRELRHARMLRGGEARETLTGTVAVTDERIPIKGSITARRVLVRTGEETSRALVCETRAKALAALGEAALYTVHGYVAAYAVKNEAAE